MKKLMSAALAAGFVLSLTACQKAPTMEELYTSIATSSSGAGHLTARIGFGEIGKDSALAVDIDLDNEFNEKVNHVSGTITPSLGGLSLAVKTETYYDRQAFKLYDHDVDNDSWTVTEYTPENSGRLDLSDIKMEDYDQLNLNEHKKGEPFTISGVLNLNKLMETVDALDDGQLDSVEEVTETEGEYENMKVNVLYTFNEKTHALEKIEVTPDEEAEKTLAEDDLSMELSFVYTVTAASSDVAIPEEALAAAK